MAREHASGMEFDADKRHLEPQIAKLQDERDQFAIAETAANDELKDLKATMDHVGKESAAKVTQLTAKVSELEDRLEVAHLEIGVKNQSVLRVDQQMLTITSPRRNTRKRRRSNGGSSGGSCGEFNVRGLKRNRLRKPWLTKWLTYAPNWTGRSATTSVTRRRGGL